MNARKLDKLHGAPNPDLHKGDRVFVGGIVWGYGILDVSTIEGRSWLVWVGPRNTPLWAGTNAIYRNETDALRGVAWTAAR